MSIIMNVTEIKETMIEKWSAQTQVYGDLDGGFPLVIFNEAMDTAMVLSPATTFMSATQYSFKDPQTGDMVLTFGPMSSVEEVKLMSVLQHNINGKVLCILGGYDGRIPVKQSVNQLPP